jgi:DNA-binding MarR family transcriptional regulator
MENMHLVGHEIKTISNLIKRRFDNSKVISEVDKLTGVHGWYIGYLYHNRDKDIFQRDIEEEFSIRRSTATGILQLMEKNGLITREPVKYDARLKKLVLTPKAIAVHEEITNEIKKIEADLVKGLSEEEINIFLLLINKMKKNLE